MATAEQLLMVGRLDEQTVMARHTWTERCNTLIDQCRDQSLERTDLVNHLATFIVQVSNNIPPIPCDMDDSIAGLIDTVKLVARISEEEIGTVQQMHKHSALTTRPGIDSNAETYFSDIAETRGE